MLLAPTVIPILQRQQPGLDQELIRKLGARAGVRITLIDRDGVVLADSEADPLEMANHRRRPEIAQLAERSVATDTRSSATLSSPHMYLAVRLPHNAEEAAGYLRLALRVDQLDDRIAATQWMIWGAALASALVALLLGIFWANHFSARVDRLSQTATHIAQGDYDLPIDISGNDQISALAQALHRMRRQLTDHIFDSERTRTELQTILETMPEAVVAVDPDQRILFANRRTYLLFGIHRGDITGQPIWKILRHPGLQDAVAKTLASNDYYSTEFEVLTPQRVIEYRGTQLCVGDHRGVLMVLHDVTELRRLERMRQDFFANVSHELKTPLAAIKAFAETLLDDEEAEASTIRHFLSRIDEQADRLHALVVDMLMLARVESKEQAFDIQTVDVHQVIEEVLRSLSDAAAARNVALNTRLAPADRYVVADFEGVATIIGNLVDNAIKYTKANGYVEISTRRQGEMIALDVADNGIGIPAEDLGRVFERFYRVDKARSRQLGGTGLGLSIVKHLTNTFAGSVSVRSQLNQGTTFTVLLPAAGEVAGEPAEAGDAKTPSGATKRRTT